jgi:hypothetical protein
VLATSIPLNIAAARGDVARFAQDLAPTVDGGMELDISTAVHLARRRTNRLDIAGHNLELVSDKTMRPHLEDEIRRE